MSAFNGSGVFVISGSGLPYVAGTTISSTVANTLDSDLATGLSNAICKDGQTTTTASIPFADGLSSGALLDISGAAAGQIKFPASQNASANVNTLDDYEESTFTPALRFGGADGGAVYTVQEGKYTKIGNRVLFDISIQTSTKSSATGVATVDGLPFTSGSFGTVPRALAVYLDNTASVTVPVATLATGVTAIALKQFTSNAIGALSDFHFTNTSVLSITGEYQTAS